MQPAADISAGFSGGITRLRPPQTGLQRLPGAAQGVQSGQDIFWLPARQPVSPDLVPPQELLRPLRLYHVSEEHLKWLTSAREDITVPSGLLRGAVTEGNQLQQHDGLAVLQGNCLAACWAGTALLVFHASGGGWHQLHLTVLEQGQASPIQVVHQVQADLSGAQILQVLAWQDPASPLAELWSIGAAPGSPRGCIWVATQNMYTVSLLRCQANQTGTSRQLQLQLVASSKTPSCIADMATSPHMGAEVAFICQDGSVHLLLLHQDSFAQAEAEEEGKEGLLPSAKALTVVAAGNTDLQPGTSGRTCLCWGHRPRSLVCAAGQKLVRCSLGALHGPADVRLVHTLREGEQFTQLAQASQAGRSEALIAACTGTAVLLFDQRRLEAPLLSWKHGLQPNPPHLMQLFASRPQGAQAQAVDPALDSLQSAWCQTQDSMQATPGEGVFGTSHALAGTQASQAGAEPGLPGHKAPATLQALGTIFAASAITGDCMSYDFLATADQPAGTQGCALRGRHGGMSFQSADLPLRVCTPLRHAPSHALTAKHGHQLQQLARWAPDLKGLVVLPQQPQEQGSDPSWWPASLLIRLSFVGDLFVSACRDATSTAAGGGAQPQVRDSAWPGQPRLHEIPVQRVEAAAQPAPAEPRRLSLKEKRQIKRAARTAAAQAAEQTSVSQAAGMALSTSAARPQRVLSRKAVNRTPTASADAAAWPAGAAAAGSATHPVHNNAAVGTAAGRPPQAAEASDHPIKQGRHGSDGPPVAAAQPAAPSDADIPGNDSRRPLKRPRATLAPALVAANLAAQKQHRERWVAQGLATGAVPTDKPPETSVLRGLPPLGTELLFHVELHHALLTAAVRDWAQGASAASAVSQGLQDANPPLQDAVDPGNVWGFASMDLRFWGLQQQPSKGAGNQQQHSPKQLQELLHKQQVPLIPAEAEVLLDPDWPSTGPASSQWLASGTEPAMREQKFPQRVSQHATARLLKQYRGLQTGQPGYSIAGLAAQLEAVAMDADRSSSRAVTAHPCSFHLTSTKPHPSLLVARRPDGAADQGDLADTEPSVQLSLGADVMVRPEWPTHLLSNRSVGASPVMWPQAPVTGCTGLPLEPAERRAALQMRPVSLAGEGTEERRAILELEQLWR